jgi:hypothetical protein
MPSPTFRCQPGAEYGTQDENNESGNCCSHAQHSDDEKKEANSEQNRYDDFECSEQLCKPLHLKTSSS